MRLLLWVLVGLILLFFSLTFYFHSLPIVTPLLPSFRLLFPWWWRCSGRRGSFPLCFGDRPWATVSERDRVQTRVGWAQARHHQLRQLRLRHADGVPVYHHGGLDRRAVLGTQMGHSAGGCMEGQRLLLTPHLPSHDIGVTRAHKAEGGGED